MNEAIEDVQSVVSDDSFASIIPRANDDLDLETYSLLYAQSSEESRMDLKLQQYAGMCAVSASDAVKAPSIDGPAESFEPSNESSSTNVGTVFSDRVDILWPFDSQYYSGSVHAMYGIGVQDIVYDDGETENLKMYDEVWNFSPHP